jgi:CBS domain
MAQFRGAFGGTMTDGETDLGLPLGLVGPPDLRGRIYDYPIGIDLSSGDGEITTLFNRLGRAIPEGQILEELAPETSARDALGLFRRLRISQAPVVANGRLIGVFSYRSFSRGVVSMPTTEKHPADLPVIDFVEPANRIFEMAADISDTLTQLDEFDWVLVGDHEHPTQIITTVDALKFFYGLSSPYVLIAEIEVALRALILSSANSEDLRRCIDAVNVSSPGKKRIPYNVSDMTFGQYVQLIPHEAAWGVFRGNFGFDPARLRDRLERLRVLRNGLFHFNKPVSNEDYELLRNEREWVRTFTMLRDAATQREIIR